MSCESIFKDICHIHARIFDHHSVFQGHINFFAKEFEERRGDREKTHLDHVQETVQQADTHTLPTIHAHLSTHLHLLTQRIKQATERCKQIAEQENESQEESEFLKSQRQARQQAMDQFMEQQCQRSARVDQQYEDNVQLFNDSYEELRQQLNQGVPFTNQTYYKFMALGKDIS
ncbi:biogenesis of lysosome-related organelles complex 1 subunit 5-like isoform X2 [Babylonia areolata]|uniref:biogenesis of lysosome-related organelles complex 1 subunit 5-like isoform X2 n=1 Tax=Babylonia areolata TaxID=304850 RepID=UPI003FD640A2